MDLGIQGRVALVTGGTRGIGRGVARALAAEGVRVAVASRSEQAVRQVAEALGSSARGYAFDSEDLEAVPALVGAVEGDLGPVDIYVANTGGPPAGDPLGFTREQWEDAYRHLVLAPMALLERALPGMRERGYGRVLAVSSSAAREPIPVLMLSNAHRSGLLAAFKTLAREVAGDGVTMNSLLPGRIATDRIVEGFGSLEEAERWAKEQVPAGRLGTVDEFGAVAAFLCSEPAGYVTGTAVLVDGGLTQSI